MVIADLKMAFYVIDANNGIIINICNVDLCHITRIGVFKASGFV